MLVVKAALTCAMLVECPPQGLGLTRRLTRTLAAATGTVLATAPGTAQLHQVLLLRHHCHMLMLMRMATVSAITVRAKARARAFPLPRIRIRTRQGHGRAAAVV